MKRLLPILGLLVCLGTAHAQTFVNAATAETNAAGSTNTVTITISSGHAVAVWCSQVTNNTATATVTDSASQTYTQATAGYASQATTNRGSWFYFANTAALTNVKCTWNPTFTGRVDVSVYDLSGMATSSLEDSSVNNSQASGTTATSGSLTTTNANDILLFDAGIVAAFTAPTAGSGYTIPASGSAARSATEYQVVSATQSAVTTTLTWTTAGTNFNGFLALKAAAASTCTPTLTLLGVGRCG